MEASLKKLDAWRSELTADVGADELRQYIGRAEEEFAAHIEINGFRKGKAPRHLARERIDQQKLLQHALETTIEATLAEALAANDLDVLKVTDLQVKENTAERLRYSVIVHLFPEFHLPSFETCQIKRKTVEVTAEEVSRALESLCMSRAAYRDKEGLSQNGDRVEVDFQVFKNGTLIEGGESKNHPLILGRNTFMPGFEDQLVGMRAGETKSFSLNAPENYFHKELAGQKLDFQVTMRTTQTVHKPPLDDAFAQSVGRFATLAQLEENVREGLKAEKQQKEKQRVQLAVLDALIEKTDLNVSQDMVTEQLDAMIADFDRDMHHRGMELGMYLAHLNKTQDDLRTEWRKDAERQVKIGLIIHKIAREQGFSASDDDVRRMTAQALQTAVEQGRTALSPADADGIRRNIAERIVQEKTLEFIENACVTA